MECKILPLVLLDAELLLLRMAVGTQNKSQHVALQVKGSRAADVISRALQMVAGVIRVCHIGQVSGLVFVEVEKMFPKEKLVMALEAGGIDAKLWKS